MKRTYTLALLFTLLCLPTQARRVKVNLDAPRYGLDEANRNGTLASRLQSVLDSIGHTLSPDDRVTIRFPRNAVWHLHATDAAPRELYISNHDQNQPKHVGIFLRGWRNLTIDGAGTQLIHHGRMLPLVLMESENVTLSNLSIDFAHPQITQVEVIANEGEHGITFRVPSWVNHRINGEGKFETYDEGWSLTPYCGIAFDKKTRHIVYRTSDLGINLSGVERLDSNTYRAPQWQDNRLPATTIVAMRTYFRPTPGIFLADNKRTLLKNINVHYAEGMGLIVQRQEDITLDRFNVCLRGKDDPRYFTTQADATHFSQCKGHIKSTRGLYEGMMDDAINVHGIYLKVSERIDDHTLRLTYGHNQAWGFAWGDAGDSVRFIDAKRMQYVDDTYRMTSIRPADKDTTAGCHSFIATFDHRLPHEVQGGDTYGIENMTWTPTVAFTDNVIRNNRARGALFSSPRRTVCERNLFDHTSGSAIVLCGDCNGWFESGAVHDLIIRRNRFVNALTSLFQFTEAVISIYPEIPAINLQTQPLHGGKLGSVVIERNVFETFDAPLLYAKSISGLRFIDNKVIHNNDFPAFHHNQHPVLFEHTRLSEAPGYDPIVVAKQLY